MPFDVYSAMLSETDTRFQAIVSVARVFIDEAYSTPMC